MNDWKGDIKTNVDKMKEMMTDWAEEDLDIVDERVEAAQWRLVQNLGLEGFMRWGLPSVGRVGDEVGVSAGSNGRGEDSSDGEALNPANRDRRSTRSAKGFYAEREEYDEEEKSGGLNTAPENSKKHACA